MKRALWEEIDTGGARTGGAVKPVEVRLHVEGAVMAAAEASGGASLEEVRRTAEEYSPS